MAGNKELRMPPISKEFKEYDHMRLDQHEQRALNSGKVSRLYHQMKRILVLPAEPLMTQLTKRTNGGLEIHTSSGDLVGKSARASYRTSEQEADKHMKAWVSRTADGCMQLFVEEAAKDSDGLSNDTGTPIGSITIRDGEIRYGSQHLMVMSMLPSDEGIFLDDVLETLDLIEAANNIENARQGIAHIAASAIQNS